MADLLTPEQRAAVDDRGRSLLVSAAAGSGKTRVLVERLFSYVEREGAQLDDFLIITYTRAAAAELRGKIAKALSERLRDEPESEHLQRQMLRLYRADIKTVDAFCTDLLRENCHLLGEDAQGRALRADFRVLDESDADALRERVLARVLDRFYEGLVPGDGGSLLADTLGAGRDDAALAALVLELHRKVQAQPWPERWLEEQERRWTDVPERIDDTPYAALLLSPLRGKALHWASLLEQGAAEAKGCDALSNAYAPGFLEAAASLRAFADACLRGWDDARGCAVEFPKLKPARKVSDEALKARLQRLWKSGKEAVKKFDEAFIASASEAADDLRAMAPAMLALLRLTGEFTRAYQAEKRRRNVADFSDQEHEAIRLLVGDDGAPTELARTVSLRYREIMVDEFQDTNEVQNRIFEAISREGKNLFTVGDVKQSIYRFRLADPTIFLSRYRAWPRAAEAAEGESAKLLLSRNFRSRREVLDAANFIFSNVLSEQMGELDYGADEALYPGAPYGERTGCETEFHLLSLSRQTGDERVSGAEAEARFVARYIRELLSGGFCVTDEQTHALRSAREEDVVILMRSPRARIPALRRALEAQGLRVSAESEGDWLDTTEISAVRAMLEIIDNPRQDVPLIAALRSPLFGFSADRLALLRGQHRSGDFYDALCADGGADTAEFLQTLRALRDAAQTMSVRRLLALLYERCSVLGVFGATAGGAERRENLLSFLAFAESFEEGGHRGLFAFVSHLRELSESGALSAPARSGSAQGVRIMSIHKSKGLEFPVVILADLAKPFNNMDFRESVLVHPKHGLGPVCVDTARRIRYPSAARLALERTLRREAKAEELRLLYVAMTRAKEKLVLVETAAHAATRVSGLLAVASCPALPEAVDEGKCLGDWVLLPLLCRPEAAPLRELADFDAPQRIVPGDTPWRVALHEELPEEGKAAATAAQDAEPCGELPLDVSALRWRYPYAGATALPAKLTATQLKGRAADAEIAENAALPPRLRSLATPRFLAPEHKLTGAERGTAVHLAMEHIDFSLPSDVSSVRAQIDGLRERRLMTPEQAEAVDADAIARFLQSDLAERIRASRSVRREYRFSLLRPARDYEPGAAEDDAVLLQGVVDCFFEEDGELVVVDFKTDRVTSAETAARAEYYRAQLEAYAAALERIMEKPVREKLLYFFAAGECVKL